MLDEWMDEWIRGGSRKASCLVFTIPNGNNRTMDLSLTMGKQRQAYRVELNFSLSHSLLLLVSFFSLFILAET